MGTAQGLISVAKGYLGTTEDDPRFTELIDYYNDHTGGYDMRYWDEWCACFVSVCSLKSGNEGATGTNVNCAEFRRIWSEKGILRDAGSVPGPGWLIEYDWEGDGVPDHIGIVVDCDGDTIHVIEGNMNEVCGERWVPVGSGSISCFGAPEYEGGNANYDESEDDMQALFQPDDQGYMLWFDGTRLHALDNPDEMEAVKKFYNASTGRDMPVFKFGSAEAPWAHRFCDAVQHGFEQPHM